MIRPRSQRDSSSSFEPRVPLAAPGFFRERRRNLNREEKARVIEDLTEKLRGNAVMLVDYQGTNVAQSTRLRARSRQEGIDFVVAKNTLAQRAADAAGVEGLDEYLVGPTAFAFSEDPVAGAKLMAEFANEIEAFELKGGVLDGGRVVDAEGVVVLSRLPGREQLLAQLLGAIQAPVAGLVTVLNAPLRNLAVVLNQVAEQKGGAEAGS